MQLARILATASFALFMTVQVSAAETPAASAASPKMQQQNDARMTQCSRDVAGYKRLARSQDDLASIQKAYLPSDPLSTKLGSVLTQINDAMTTLQKRVGEHCPGYSV